MKNFRVTAQSLADENIKREFIIEAENEEKAKEISTNRMIAEESNDMLLESPLFMTTTDEINLYPHNITDIIDNIEFYVNEMRKTKNDDAIPKMLRQYAWEYFRNVEINKGNFRKTAIFVVDKLYRVTAGLTLMDNYTRAFFAKVIPFFWDTYADRGVDIFYIVDNTFKDDVKFRVVVELFQLTGMAVVTPYNEKGNLDCGEVEKQIREYLASFRMVMYIEKDASVNYLDEIKKLAVGSKYLSIFRNKASRDARVEIISEEDNSVEK